MNSLPDKELLLDAFAEYLREELNLRTSKVEEYKLAVKHFIDYLNKIHGGQWEDHIQDEQAISGFIDSEFRRASDETRDTKKDGVQIFQRFLKGRGRLAWFISWIRRRQRLPIIILLGFLIAVTLTVITYLGFFGVNAQTIVGSFFPSRTPTVTNTPPPTKTATVTLTPSPTSTPTPTLTLTSTLTPTPNATQIFLATQLPTANPGFTPQVRTQNNASEQVFVPAGAFLAGDQTDVGDPDEVVHQVYIDSFWIDRFLVTNGQFAKCPENICGQPESFISHKRPNGYYGVPEFKNYPVMELTWSQAEAFCEWKGGRLPTEAEWEKAAGWNPVSGQMQPYPWGNEPPDDSLANYDNVDLDTTEVGAYPKGVSPVGAYDMIGNVWEWIYDWYGPYDLNQQINPMGPSSGELKVVKGGSWSNDTKLIFLRVANRGKDFPNNATNEKGFRCVFLQ